MNELTLSTGRKVMWGKLSPKSPMLAIHFDQSPTDQERVEAATEINKILHPTKQEKPNAA